MRKRCGPEPRSFTPSAGILKKKGYSTGVGDEGGFAPSLKSNREAVDLVLEAVSQAGFTPGQTVFVALDVASSELWDEAGHRYEFKKSGDKARSAEEMVALYEDWVRQYPIISIEDGLAEGDWDGWKLLTSTLGARVQLVGDDVFVTNPEILRRGIAEHVGNALLVKLNQIGTVTETLDAVAIARDASYASVISHRSGETEDTTIADLAVAYRRRPDQDRLGQPHRSRGQVQPAAADRRGAGCARPLRRKVGDQAARSVGVPCTLSFSCGTARAPGTRKTGSPDWVDVDLTERGREEAHEAGRLLKEGGYTFDLAYTSVLKRAIRTLWITLDDMDLMWIPVVKSWRLNERHYGALQGLNKAETAAKHGDEQVKIWRRSYDIPPPPLTLDDPRYPGLRSAVRRSKRSQLPLTESLKDTVARFLPYWHETIAPAIRNDQRVLIAAHGNSLRALVKYLDNVSEQEIVELNIPTGIPLVYELDDDLKPLRHFYLGDPKAAEAAAARVAQQASRK